jgi:hypothetical protein
MPGEEVADTRPESGSMRGCGGVEIAGRVAWVRGGVEAAGVEYWVYKRLWFRGGVPGCCGDEDSALVGGVDDIEAEARFRAALVRAELRREPGDKWIR